jgi:molybdopterin/thiamine biosynthesis adenylyltransferase
MLNREERERYSRQILLYGSQGQMSLKAASVVVVGAGGLGATILPILAAAGVGKIHLFDHDVVERSNLSRQLLFRESDIGRPKSQVAAAYLRLLNPHVEVFESVETFNEKSRISMGQPNMLLEGSDDVETKFYVNNLSLQLRIPTIIASLGHVQGHAMLIHGADSPCYRCVFDPLDAGELPSCASEGILSSFPAVIGSMVANLALQFILGERAKPGLWVFEKNNCRKVHVTKRLGCIHET